MNESPFVNELQKQLEQGIPQRAQRQGRQRLAAGGAALTLAIGGLGAFVLAGSNALQTDQVEVGPATTASTSTVEDGPLDLPPPDPSNSFWDYDPAPLEKGRGFIPTDGTSRSVMIWTGDDLVVYGRSAEDAQREFPDGWIYTEPAAGRAYDPTVISGDFIDAADLGRVLSEAAWPELFDPVGVWSGSEMIICCGSNEGARAAAWNPESDTWRELKSPPIETNENATAIWVKDRMVVFAGQDVMVYEPSSDSWQTFESPIREPMEVSVAAIDDRVAMWPRPSQRKTATGSIFDPVNGEWTSLPAPPTDAWPAMADIAWTGEELIVMGGLPASTADSSERLVGARLNLDTMQWNALPDVFPEPDPCECNLGSQSLAWIGDRLIVNLGLFGSGIGPNTGQTYAYEPAIDTWWELGSVGPGLWGRGHVVTDNNLIAQGSDLMAIMDFDVLRGGVQVPVSGIPPTPVPDFEESPSHDAAITLVGTDADGSIVVVESDGYARFSLSETSLGSGAITGSSMDYNNLYVWRDDEKVYGYSSGPGLNKYERNRLAGRELYQSARIFQAFGDVDEVYPVGDNQAWVATSVDTRLVDMSTGDTLYQFHPGGGAVVVGTLGDKGLVLHSDSNMNGFGGGIVVDAQGEKTEFTDEPLIGVTGNYVISQSCDDDGCSRTSHYLGLPSGAYSKTSAEDGQFEYQPVAGPIWPPETGRLEAASPGGKYLLVKRVVYGSSDDSWHDLALFDATTKRATSLVTSEQFPDLNDATWSRDGRHVVIVSGDTDLATIDLETGAVAEHTDVIPEGLEILAAG